MKNIEQYRKSGYKVRVVHRRYDANGELIQYSRKIKGNIAAKGGIVTVELTTPEGVNVYGNAVCSKKENYCYSKGVQIALGRAIAGLEKATA